MAEPVYQHIEFCSSPANLYGKLESGIWEWLGVKPDGTFVLGSPARRGGIRFRAAGSRLFPGHVQGHHGVTVSSPGEPSSKDWTRNVEQARAHFEAVFAQLQRRQDPRLLRVRLLEHGRVVREEYVVRNPSTYR